MLLDEAIQAGIDLEIPVTVRQTSRKGTVLNANDFSSAEFSLYTMTRNKLLTKTLGNGILVDEIDGNNIFVITLTDTDTLSLNGLY